ncbi:MAG: DegV family protein [Anaerolineales bacterium]|jgi:DegV family protein with EDD domain
MSFNKIAIVTDSSTYIPPEETVGLDIHVIPLWLIWDDDRFRDGVDIQPTDFYQRLRGAKTMPSSSQPSSGEFVSLFKQLSADHDAVVAVLVSDKLSGTVASALAAQQELSDLKIEVFDSANVSMGLGYCVLAAARAAAEGKSVEEILLAAKQMSEKIHFLFAVDTLEFLRRGGRIGGAKALLGSALSIKPLLHFHDGVIEPLMQVRTKKKAIATMLDVAEERLAGQPMAEATVLDVDNEEEGDRVAEMVRQRFSVEKVIRTTVSPVVGTHAGPGTVGMVFYAQD